ncbi:MAG: DUF1801 domain-containing protein [Reichenbachiella sp.]
MESVLSYINSRETNQSAIMMRLHRMITDHPKVTAQIKYKIPTYKYFNPLCYLNPLKGGGVEMVFVRARELSNEQGVLDFKKRVWMAGISFSYVHQINDQMVNEILQEAFLLDETVVYRPTKL